jgi:cytochrome c oxidase subunit III
VSATPVRVALDVSALPEHAFGHRSVMWWATMCMVAIEATAFALAIASYLYLKGRVPQWPPGVPTPGLFWGTVNVVLLVASAWPNLLAKRAAERVQPVRCSSLDGGCSRLCRRF